MKNVGDMMNRSLDQHNWRDRLDQTRRQVLADSEVQAFIQDHQDQLNEDQIDRSISKLYEYCQERDRIRAGEPAKFPNYSPQLIMNEGYIDVKYVATAEFQARQAEIERRRRVQLVELPQDLRQASFDDFDSSDPRRQDALEQALIFVERMKDAPQSFHQGLYLYGPFGVGKTYLLAAVANDLSEVGLETTLVHYPTFVSEMRSAVRDSPVQDRLEAIASAQILMLDDVGAESNTAWIRDDILGVILQTRMSNRRPTFFSSNFSMAQFEDHLSHTSSGNEPVKARRIMERVRTLATEVAMSGRNRRRD